MILSAVHRPPPSPFIMMLLIFCFTLLHGVTAQFTISYTACFEVIGRPTDLDGLQMNYLEFAFGTVYNDMEQKVLETTPAPFVRSITSVEIQDISTDLLEDDPSATQVFSVLFLVTLTCELQACDPALRLFADSKTGNTAFESFGDNLQLFSTGPWHGPTPALFLFFYNMFLPSMELDAVDSIRNIKELETIFCSNETATIETDVVIDFEGDADLASEEELAAVAEAFLETYNALNSFADADTCDVFFRRVIRVEIDIEATRSRSRQLQFGGVPGSRPGSNVTELPFFSSIARTVYQCRGCRKDEGLFDNDAALRRDLQHQSTSQEGSQSKSLVNNRHLQILSDSDCVCAVEADEFRPPTSEEFTAAFNRATIALTEQGVIDFIAGIEEVTEVEPVVCNATVETRSVNVLIDVSGNSSAVTQSDTKSLELGFIQAYNEAAENNCDTLFRTVVNASLIDTDFVEERRRRQLRRSRFNITLPFVLLYNITFSCRGCSKDVSLFGNDAARWLVQSSSPQSSSSSSFPYRSLQEADVCYCSIDAEETDAPSVSEFAPIFDEVIVTNFNVSSIASVDSAIELVMNSTLGNRPSGSTSPSGPMFTFPTLSPMTPSPSVTLSRTPTNMPSVTPSTAPSSMPSNAPSPMPIGQEFIVDVTQSHTPTNMPSGSTSPSGPMFTLPTLSPMTPSPSVTQSHTPTNMPSVIPSTVPSSMPSNSPSFMPIAQNTGQEFIVSFLTNSADSILPSPELHLSTIAAIEQVLVTVEYPVGTYFASLNVTAGEISTLKLPYTAGHSTGWSINNPQPQNNSVRAFTESSAGEFIMYIANLYAFTSDAAVALPVAALNTKYIVADYSSNRFSGVDRADFVVTAVADNTTVSILTDGRLGSWHEAGAPFTVLLNRGESFYATSDSFSLENLSGTQIEASKPVTVTNGNWCVFIPNVSVRACDHIFEVAQPVQTWGKTTTAVNLPLRPAGSIYRVFASEDETSIRVNTNESTIELNLGKYVELGPRADSILFESDSPFFVVQFMTGVESLGTEAVGDPAMGNMIPVEQYRLEYTFTTLGRNQFTSHYLSVIAHVLDIETLTFDGAIIAASVNFTQISSSDYYSVVFEIDEGAHTTSSTNQGHGITVEGYGSADSYLYPGGAQFRLLNP